MAVTVPNSCHSRCPGAEATIPYRPVPGRNHTYRLPFRARQQLFRRLPKEGKCHCMLSPGWFFYRHYSCAPKAQSRLHSLGIELELLSSCNLYWRQAISAPGSCTVISPSFLNRFYPYSCLSLIYPAVASLHRPLGVHLLATSKLLDHLFILISLIFLEATRHGLRAASRSRPYGRFSRRSRHET
jgi:hypothetical protein